MGDTSDATIVLQGAPTVFDPDAMLACWEKCAGQADAGGDVELESFIAGYQYLCVLLEGLGKAFGFITADLKEKLNCLMDKRSADVKANGTLNNFDTLKHMIEHESIGGFKNVKPKTAESAMGARQYQLILRALKMLQIFLWRLATNGQEGGYDKEQPINAGGNAGIGAWVKDGYERSPMPDHHPMPVRLAVKACVIALPYRNKFFDDMKASMPADKKEMTVADAEILLKATSKAMKTVYETSEKIFKSYPVDQNKPIQLKKPHNWMWGLN